MAHMLQVPAVLYSRHLPTAAGNGEDLDAAVAIDSSVWNGSGWRQELPRSVVESV